jgi:hypothetical protein
MTAIPAGESQEPWTSLGESGVPLRIVCRRVSCISRALGFVVEMRARLEGCSRKVAVGRGASRPGWRPLPVESDGIAGRVGPRQQRQKDGDGAGLGRIEFRSSQL